jgi:hypothetical protein
MMMEGSTSGIPSISGLSFFSLMMEGSTSGTPSMLECYNTGTWNGSKSRLEQLIQQHGGMCSV